MQPDLDAGGSVQHTGSNLPVVRIVTELGDILIEIDDRRAPRSAGAFLELVEAGAYDGGEFGRILRLDNDRGMPRIQAIQGAVAPTVPTTADLAVETTGMTGLRHADGTISLPRAKDGLGSAHGFFVCVGAQPALDEGGGRASDSLGFAAFGCVIEGMKVVREIHSVATSDEAPDEYVRGQIPIRPVTIQAIRREPADAAGMLATLADEYWRFRIREFPVEAGLAGVRSANSRLDDETAAGYARRATAARAMLDRASAIDGPSLDDENATTLVLLSEQLASIIELNAHEEFSRPRLFPFSLANYTGMILQQASLVSLQDRADLIARFEAMPQVLEARVHELRKGFANGHRIPRPLVARALDMIDSELADDGLEAAVQRRFADPIHGADAALIADQAVRAITLVTERIRPVISRFRDMIANLDDGDITDEVGLTAQPGGRAYYQFKVRQQTSTDLDPDTIHALGLEEVARIRRELDALLKEIGREGELSAVAAELQAGIAPDAQTLLLQTRALAKRIDGLLPKFFGHMPRVTYAVEQLTESASAALPPAYAQPAPADRTMAGIFWLTAIPDRLPLHILAALTLHEAWPGHLMQLAIANELDHLPSFRRYGMDDYNGYIEGWALYCERLGQDLGIYETPADRWGFLLSDLWRAARLVIDTGLHWKGWSREAAVVYLEQTSLLPRVTCESEIDRYIGIPAQALSYKLGEMVITGLRREAERALKGRFSLSEFHDVVLALGPISLTELERRIRGWMHAKSCTHEAPASSASSQAADKFDAA